MMNSTSTVIICVIVAISYFIRGAHTSTEERTLQNDLFFNYSADIRPVQNYSEILYVDFGFDVIGIMDVDEKNQRLTVRGLIKSDWYDYQLRWNPDDYNGITELAFNEDWAWKPSWVLSNSATEKIFFQTSKIVKVTYEGRVSFSSPTVLSVPCDMDIRYFPFDTQSCNVYVATWQYTADLLRLEPMTDSLSTEITNSVGENTEWFFESGTMAVRLVNSYSPLMTWSVLIMSLTFERRPLYYIINIILPAILMSLLTLLVYVLPCDCAEKKSFSISIFISMSVFNLIVGSLLPETSGSVPLIGRFHLFNMAFVSFSTLVATVVLHIHHRQKANLEMSFWVRRVFIEMLPRLLMMEKLKSLVNDDGDFVRRGKIHPLTSPGDAGSMKTKSVNVLDIEDVADGMYEDSHYSRHQKTDVVEDILGEIKGFGEKAKLKQKEQMKFEEWRYVALVIDRLGLYSSIFAFTIGSMYIFAESSGN